jgi:hypothetical protein
LPADRILSAADLQSFRSLANSLSGAEGVAVSRTGFGQHVERAGSLRSAVAWSTSKVPVAMAVIARGGAQAQQLNLFRAITASDNTAALELWSSLGNSDQAAAAADAQLRTGGDNHTTIESRSLRGDAYTPFGQTAWTLTDQARFTAGMVCSTAGKEVLRLMSQVAPEQRWGLGDAGGSPASKGGWGPGSQPGIAGGDLDRQMGVITVRGRQLAVAIATQPSDGAHATGISNLTAITRWLVSHAGVTRVPAQTSC